MELNLVPIIREIMVFFGGSWDQSKVFIENPFAWMTMNQFSAIIFFMMIVLLIYVFFRAKFNHDIWVEQKDLMKKISKDTEDNYEKLVKKKATEINELKDKLEACDKKISDLQNEDLREKLRLKAIFQEILAELSVPNEHMPESEKACLQRRLTYPFLMSMSNMFDKEPHESSIVTARIESETKTDNVISLTALKQIKDALADVDQEFHIVHVNDKSETTKLYDRLSNLYEKVGGILDEFGEEGYLKVINEKVDCISTIDGNIDLILESIQEMVQTPSSVGSNVDLILEAVQKLEQTPKSVGGEGIATALLEGLDEKFEDYKKEDFNAPGSFISCIKDAGFSSLSIEEKMKQVNEDLSGTYTEAIIVPEDFEFNPEMMNPTIESLIYEVNSKVDIMNLQAVLVHSDIDEDELKTLVIKHIHENVLS